MGYFKRLTNAVLNVRNDFDLSNMSDDDVREFVRIGGGTQTISGRTINEKETMKIAAANRCIQIVSSVVACMPRDLIERVNEDERQPAEGHPIRRIMTVKPNNFQTPKQFIQLMMVWLLLRGNAFALKVMSGDKLIALLPMHPDKMEVQFTAANRKVFIFQNDKGAKVKYNDQQILHVTGLSLDGITGLSVIGFMRESLALALDGEHAASYLMKNGTFSDIVLKHPDKMSKEAYARLAESWENRRTGVDNAGKTAILEEGTDIARTAISASDLQFLEQRDFQRYDIAMFYGVPPHMLGATEKTTSWGSGIESLGIGFVTYTINDWLVTWQETVKRDLMTEKEAEKYDFRFYTQGLLKGDSKAQWDAFTRGRQWGIYSPNDVRRMLDMNPRTDPEGDEYALPPNETKDEVDEDDPEIPPTE